MLWSNRFLSNVVSIHFLFKQLSESDAMYSSQDILLLFGIIIAELTECSPIIIQNGSSNPSSQKNLASIQGATFKIHGQLYLQARQCYGFVQ